MKDYYYIIFAFSAAVVLMAFLPLVLKRLRLAFTVPLVLIGLLFYYLGVPVNWSQPLWENEYVKIVTEIIVIISLMGAGLKMGMQYGLNHWKNPLRLIYTTMPLYIISIFFLGKYILGLDGPSALLFAAVCAPTDPVLASEFQLQTDELKDKKNTGMRYLLTAEAGLNDGIAFPFVFLAILWSKAGGFMDLDWGHWTGYYFFYKIIGGVLIGSLLGFIFSWSIRKIHNERKEQVLRGFVAIALAFVSFGLAEILGTYGFLSTFFTALFAQFHYHLDRAEDDGNSGEKEDKKELLVFNEDLEELMIIVWTLVFGGFVATGILSHTGILGVITVVLAILVIRPLCGRIALIGTPYTEKKKWAVGFFGMKGVGSFFYLAFALNENKFEDAGQLYALVSYLVLFSILVHGTTGRWVIDYFKKYNPG